MEITIAIIFGMIIGFIASFLLKNLKKIDDITTVLIISIAVLFAIAISHTTGVSIILINLVIGGFLANSLKEEHFFKVSTYTDYIMLPLLLFFFTFSGAELKIDLLVTLEILGMIYIFVRVIGKII